jgi:hypothetical protein
MAYRTADERMRRELAAGAGVLNRWVALVVPSFSDEAKLNDKDSNTA